MDEFNKPKIVWNRIAAIKQFALVETEMYIQDSMHFITGNNLTYLCSVLNSKPIQWLLSKIIGEAVGGNAGNADNILNLPIPIPKNMYITDNELYKTYGLTKEEMDFIEQQR